MNRPSREEYNIRSTTIQMNVGAYLVKLERYCDELEKENQKYKKYYNDFIQGDCDLCKWERHCDIQGRVKKENGTMEECDFGSLWELEDE